MLFVAYRDNALFRTYLPELLQGLPVVDTFILPEGEQLIDHKDRFIAAVNGAAESGICQFLVDRVCNLNFYGDNTHHRVICGRQFFEIQISLDGIFRDEVIDWMNKNDAAANINWLAERVAYERTVENIFIVRDFIGQHGINGKNAPCVRKNLGFLVATLEAQFPFATVDTTVDLEEACLYCNDTTAMLVDGDEGCGLWI